MNRAQYGSGVITEWLRWTCLSSYYTREFQSQPWHAPLRGDKKGLYELTLWRRICATCPPMQVLPTLISRSKAEMEVEEESGPTMLYTLPDHLQLRISRTMETFRSVRHSS